MLVFGQLLLGFIFLLKGGSLLVDGASSLARRFRVSDLVIGLTVVAFGTSAPELFVNLQSSVSGATGLAIGNVLGSNIANILLILGVSALVHPLSVSRGTVWKEIPLSLLAAVSVGILANDALIDGEASSSLTRIDGLVLLLFFVLFIAYSAGIAGRVPGAEQHLPEEGRGAGKAVLFVCIGLGGLVIGGNWVVDAAVTMARLGGISERVIGLTVVAVGTSLPELVTSAVAAYRKNVEIAVGNVVGSNIFNIFFVLGISSSVRPLPFTGESNTDILAVIGASLLLFFAMFTGKRTMLDRWEGALFTALYSAYLLVALL